MKAMQVLLAAAGLGGAAAFCRWQNNSLQTTRLTVESARLPGAFDGFRILQVSDLHDKRFGRRQERLLEGARRLSPDLIALTGDLCDADPDAALTFVRAAARLAPVCFAPGNHEARSGGYAALLDGLRKAGVALLTGKRWFLHRGDAKICIAGALDPAFFRDPMLHRDTPQSVAAFARHLGDLAAREPKAGYTVLLSHRPERFALYLQNGFDLTLSGHAHGGQFRFPGVPGLYAPEQGIFPRFTAGLYRQKGGAMVVSRGLGRSSFPQRLGNRPELVLITLKREI